MPEQPQIIRFTLLAAALGTCDRYLERQISQGNAPTYQFFRNEKGRYRAYPISVIRAWRPEIAARCLAMLNAC